MLMLPKRNETGLPSKANHKQVENFEKKLANQLKDTPNKPNALFLGRITWNDTAELIWRVYDAESAHQVIQSIIANKQHPFEFNFRIDHDPQWKLAEWHLENAK